MKVKARPATNGVVSIFCPACGHGHTLNYLWSFNGNFNKPTFTPSLKVTGVQPLTDDQVTKIMAGEKIEPKPYCCHSYITDGKIQYLADCTHNFAGQTVDLPDF